jgi:hypothetical protein
MDEMEWAVRGLDYLHKARTAIHEDFNEIRKQFTGMPSATQRESRFKGPRNICAHLDHYSWEFVQAKAIPSSKYASPQAFKDRLAVYRGLQTALRGSARAS